MSFIIIFTYQLVSLARKLNFTFILNTFKSEKF